MLTKEFILTIRILYEKIFKEVAENSKEFITFVQGNPHPLRIKVEDYIDRLDIRDETHPSYILDELIMEYIENNIEE